ncbi:hypothetical protein ATZ33_00145 [Enterococcus silesiacus]|nr:MFS transporter [Enterococcus silesiacus]ALR99847.1 hypothetical protein ATZ33_00145 [Enterococcus silesiacus]
MKQKSNFNYFMALWIGELVSLVGNGLSSFALSIYVYQQTGEATHLSLLTLFSFLPSVLLTPIAGGLADRFNRRVLMLIGDSLSAVGLIFIYFHIQNGTSSFTIIVIGVTISSIFSSLLEPAYRATITEILTPDEFSKASGLVQLAGAAKFLFAPLLAGILLQFMSIEKILLIDISTFFVTVASILYVMRAKKTTEKKEQHEEPFLLSLKNGWDYMMKKQGIIALILAMTIVSFSMGFLQTLIKPLLLSSLNVAQVGTFESFAAVGMLVSSLAIGLTKRKWQLQQTLGKALLFSGLAISLLGVNFPIVFLGLAAFCFFSFLPFINMSADVLLRSNVDEAFQGRVWGITGLVSQFGFVISYAISGPLADYLFIPIFATNGILAPSLGKIFGVGNSRGIGFLFFITGILLSCTGVYFSKSSKINLLSKNADVIRDQAVEAEMNESFSESELS